MTTQNALRIRTMVVPSLPGIDKYVAALRQILDHQNQLIKFDYAFSTKNYPDEEDRLLWDRGEEGSAVLIDVGDFKYHKGWQSASDFQMMHSTTHRSHIWNRMVPLINVNNKTGFLKRLPFSFASMIREIPHTFANRERGEKETWSYALRAIRSMFRRANVRSWDDLSKPEFASLARFWEGFGLTPSANSESPFHMGIPDPDILLKLHENIRELNMKYPGRNLKFEDVIDLIPYFTLPGYFNRMFLAGDSPDIILREMSWWADKQKAVRDRRQQARCKDFSYMKFRFTSGMEEFRAGLVHVHDYFEAEAFMYRYVGTPQDPLAIAILRNSNGGTVMVSSMHYNVDLRRVFAKLDELEPGRWYEERRFHGGKIAMVMNQSWQFIGVKPTSLPDSGLMDCVQFFADCEARKKGNKK